MAWLGWLTRNWFDLLQTAGIVAGLFFTGCALHRSTKSERADNLFQLTAQHRELWLTFLDQPELARVLQPGLDLVKEPLKQKERLFVNLLILHLNSTHRAIKLDVMKAPEGLAADIRGFFALPIPQAVWRQARILQDADFVAFVEQA